MAITGIFWGMLVIFSPCPVLPALVKLGWVGGAGPVDKSTPVPSLKAEVSTELRAALFVQLLLPRPGPGGFIHVTWRERQLQC